MFPQFLPFPAFPLCYNLRHSLGRGAIGSTPDFGSVNLGSSPGAPACVPRRCVSLAAARLVPMSASKDEPPLDLNLAEAALRHARFSLCLFPTRLHRAPRRAGCQPA